MPNEPVKPVVIAGDNDRNEHDQSWHPGNPGPAIAAPRAEEEIANEHHPADVQTGNGGEGIDKTVRFADVFVQIDDICVWDQTGRGNREESERQDTEERRDAQGVS